MSNRQCPKCGEEYSDTYRTCPFCEEEAAIRKGKPLSRRGGRRVEKRQRGASGGAGGVMLLLTGVIILGVLGFVFFGDQIAGTMGIRTDPDIVDDDPAGPAPDAASAPGGSQGEQEAPPEDAAPADGTAPADPAGEIADDPPAPTEPLSLSQSSMTIAAGETARLTASGGAGNVIWTTSNENVASVDGGSVTGKAGGTATITAASGGETASCSVTITGTPYVSNANLSLNKTDFTLGSGDPDVQMKVKGTDSPVTWASANTGVATVSESGVVKWAGKGTTTITATVDGQVLECIVRAK